MALPIQAVSKRAAWKEALVGHAGDRNELTVTSPPGENLDVAREPALKHRFALMLFAAIFAGPGGSPVFAQDANHRLTAATSSNPAAEGNRSENGTRPEASPEPREHGLPQQATEITRLFGLPITNSMIVTWIVALGLIISAQLATRKMDLVPAGLQNFWEWSVESLHTFLEQIIGKRLVERTFWFFASTFIFILATNWAGLIPGVGTVGWGHQTAQGFRVDRPLFRAANADLNLTLAVALVFFVCWIVWAIQVLGPRGFLRELFAPKGESAGVMRVVMVVVFFAAGCLDIISTLFRPVSLSFRLYGNMFAGDNMLDAMAGLVPSLGWLLPIPFYFMELLVGFIQAMVFMLLTAVFTLLACQSEGASATAAHN